MDHPDFVACSFVEILKMVELCFMQISSGAYEYDILFSIKLALLVCSKKFNFKHYLFSISVLTISLPRDQNKTENN